MATAALLAMAAFLRELALPRPAALFGAFVFAWQGDILPFVFPGHYAYIALWPFFAIAAWAALRSERTGHWAYAVIAGLGCGTMVQLAPDRGGIACLMIAALFLAAIVHRGRAGGLAAWRPLGLCVATAFAIALAALLALYQNNIAGVTLGRNPSPDATFALATEFCIGPAETLTYLIPGFFGWHSSNPDGPYWGWIGQAPGWHHSHQGPGQFNLAISTTGTISTVLAVFGFLTLLVAGWRRDANLDARQVAYGKLFAVLGTVALVLAWGYHTPLYRILFALPLMDKWRNPLKWLEITNFAVVTLSAYGVAHLLRALEPGAVILRRVRLFLIAALALLVLSFLIGYPLGIMLKPSLEKAGFQPYAIANVMGTLNIANGVAVTLIALALLLIWLAGRPELLRRWQLPNPLLHRAWQAAWSPAGLGLTVTLGLIVLVFVQLAWVDTQFIFPAELAGLTEDNNLVEALKAEGDRVRVTVDAQDETLGFLLLNQFAADDISCLDIPAASRFPALMENFLDALNQNRARLWLLAGVKNAAMTEEALPQIRQVPGVESNIASILGFQIAPPPGPDLPSHALVQFRNYFPKALFVPGAEVIADQPATLKRLTDPAWDPRATVLLPAAATPPAATAAAGSQAQNITPAVRLTTYTPNDIVAEVSSPGGYLLINDMFDPDWSVRINDQPAPLLRADYVFRAVALPPGTAHVAFHYALHYRVGPLAIPALVLNLLCDGVMLLGWIGAGVALRRAGPTTAAGQAGHAGLSWER
jgi:hypothetical protein